MNGVSEANFAFFIYRHAGYANCQTLLIVRLRLHGSGRIFARTNFVPGPPVYMDLCKFCYRLQWCLHGSVQILDQSRHLNGFFTALL